VSSEEKVSIVDVYFLAIFMAAIQVLMIVFAFNDKDFSLRWKVKALFLLPVLPFITFFDVYVKFFRGDLP
jgi:hypothetical protein